MVCFSFCIYCCSLLFNQCIDDQLIFLFLHSLSVHFFNNSGHIWLGLGGLLLDQLGLSRVVSILKYRMQTELVCWSSSVRVRVNVSLQFLDPVVYNDIIPLLANTFGIFNIRNGKDRAVLVFYSHRVDQLLNMVWDIADHVLW